MKKMMTQNIVRGISCGVLALTLTATGAQAQDGKIKLLITTIETPDTRTDHLLAPVPIPPYSAPHSNADLQKLSGARLEEAQKENAKTAQAYREICSRVLFNEYERRVKRQDEIAQKAKNTVVGRNLTMARDWVISALMSNTECKSLFDIISRIDIKEGLREEIFNGKDPLDVENGTYFVKIVVDDPDEDKSPQTPLGGGYSVGKVTTKQLITIHIQDFNNKFIFSQDFTNAISEGVSNFKPEASSDRLKQNLRECFKKAAEGMAEDFSVKLTIRLKGPKGDTEFDPDDAIVTLNGKKVSLDTPITCVKGKHLVEVEMDGYETFTIEYDLSKESGKVTKTITPKSNSVKLTLKLKGPKGDTDFDADYAMVTLNDKKVSLDKSITCEKGEHEVKVEMDGYETLTVTFDFSKEDGNVTETLILKKAKNAE